MKAIKILLLFSLLAGISLLAEIINEKYQRNEVSTKSEERETNSNKHIKTEYRIVTRLEPSTHSINVEETIVWKNTDSLITDSLFLNLPVSSKLNSDDYSKLTYKLEEFQINGSGADFKYIPTTNKNFIDSSLVVVKLFHPLIPNEVIKIRTNYRIELPKERKWSDAQFYNFENWYVTISPTDKGKFTPYHTHGFIKSFQEYSNYNVKLILPDEFDAAIPGQYKFVKNGKDKEYSIEVDEISSFNWFLFNDLKKHTRKINIGTDEINLEIFIKKSKENYIERYVEGVKKYLTTLSSYTSYPFKKLSIVDIPSVEGIENKSYPNLIAIKTDLISPVNTQKFEYALALVVAEQYFGNLINANPFKYSWLSKGLSAFIAEKLVRMHYGDLLSYFNVANYYPIYGLHFMSFRSIPLIYVISKEVIPEGARNVKEYYNNLKYADISIPTYLLPNYTAYKVASVIKPKLALLAIEKFIGTEEMGNRLLAYFRDNVGKYPTGKDFIRKLTTGIPKNEMLFFNELFTTDKKYDYAISSINRVDKNSYEITVERIEDGVYPININVYTEADTLKLYWSGEERYKIFNIKSKSQVIAAEIDSEMKNILDLNFANNSYVVDAQYWGSISYATRVFFWFQNALMLIGG